MEIQEALGVLAKIVICVPMIMVLVVTCFIATGGLVIAAVKGLKEESVEWKRKYNGQ